MVENLSAHNELGELVKIQERKSLLKEIREYSYGHGDTNLAVPVFHLMLTNSKGKLYIVQRADKPENPFLYDKTAGGHVKAGESYVASLIREGDEEVGVHIIVADLMNYREIAEETDLTEYAVVRAIDFDPWSKSIRTVKNGKPWVKRDRAVTFAGMYDGPLQYKDGEAMGCIMLTPEELRTEIEREPNKFTYDLTALLDKYQFFFNPIKI